MLVAVLAPSELCSSLPRDCDSLPPPLPAASNPVPANAGELAGDAVPIPTPLSSLSIASFLVLALSDALSPAVDDGLVEVGEGRELEACSRASRACLRAASLARFSANSAARRSATVGSQRDVNYPQAGLVRC